MPTASRNGASRASAMTNSRLIIRLQRRPERAIAQAGRSFGTDFCCCSDRSLRQDIEGLGRAHRVVLGAHVPIVDWLGNCGLARNLGLHAVWLVLTQYVRTGSSVILAMSALAGKAEIFCSIRALPVVTRCGLAAHQSWCWRRPPTRRSW